ncbi:MAG: 23S rRNA (pseudouridine(1915)-N(3))-methyltransferase RlmH [Muribaculaceae bacterium]|nr:23S rRNA (pseudouridine(1915)-N(3))-methyltransferase RlmH [Muribaculaceae bacterium]
MKIQLLVIGKTSADYISKGTDLYLNRLSHYIPTEIKVLPDIKNTRKLTEEQQKTAEGEEFLNALQGGDYVVLLDERGKEFTSREFSTFIQQKMNTVSRNLVFIIGGPYGFSKAVYDRADSLLSLSRMTFSHEMVRLFFIEQIYRAMTILRGEPYHHD